MLMKCGHSPNSTCNGKPFCVICGCGEIADSEPNLEGRMAECRWCGHKTQSKFSLPFFEYCPNSDYDNYYCGCGGWD